jgi:hypothetical protein
MVPALICKEEGGDNDDELLWLRKKITTAAEK